VVARLGTTHARAATPAPEHQWPEEFRNLLLQANEEADRLRDERRALAARVTELEAELEKARKRGRELAGRLEETRRQKPQALRGSDDWLAEVTDRTTTALKSGQEVAQNLVERARQRAAEIERAAAQHAAEVRQRAEAEANRMLQVAQLDAEGVLQGAQASAGELLTEAQRVRDSAVASFNERHRAMQDEIARLDAQRLKLLETCAALRSPIEEAIRTLERGSAAGPQPRRRPGRRA
jgi:cell division septum initiation protein DivIVA